MRFGSGMALIVAMWAASAQAQSALCRNPAGFCGAKITSAGCLGRLGAGAGPETAAAEGDLDCAAQLGAYRDCVARAAEECGPEAAGAGGGACSDATALALWASAERDNDCLGYQSFRDACPNSPQARFVASRLGRLGCGADAPAAPAPDYRAAQTELQRLGFYTGPVDGDWGTGSTRAMRRFQLENGLSPADGSLTSASLEALKTAPTPERRAAAPAASGGVFRDCGVCPEMVEIPAGSFQMGSNSGDGDEKPVHRVSVPRFAMGRTEVTFAQWDACVADGGCEEIRPNEPNRARIPALYVSWVDAQAYVQWINGKVAGAPYRLPSEAEWEYAARAGTSTAYFWGDAWDAGRANGGFSRVRPVASYPANGFKLHDMHGNVAEWLQDCWNHGYSGAPADGSAWMSGDCSMHVLRGGSWQGESRFLRSADRNRSQSRYRSLGVGLRLARTQR